MRNSSRAGNAAFFLETGKWALGLVAVVLVWGAFNQALVFREGTAWGWIHVIVTDLGLLLPFAAFAGGVATHRSVPVHKVVIRASVVALVVLGLLGYASPIAEYRGDASRGLDTAARYPFGPSTLKADQALRDAVEANPPEEYTYRVDRPFTTPPNWSTYLIHSRVALSVFAVLSALLGWLVAVLTSGLSPPGRKNVRWALGLASGLGTFIPLYYAGEWVRQDLANSGLVGSYLPLLVPLVELLVLAFLVRPHRNQLHGSKAARI